jgi:hypothetical protein
LSARATAQEAAPSPSVPLTGTVLARGDRAPLAGVTVVLDGGAAMTTTDEAGHFALATVTVGLHHLTLTGGDIDAVDATITARPGTQLQLIYYVTRNQRYASTVRGKRVVVETIEQRLQLDEIKHIPGTQGDLLKAVQNLPGVAQQSFGNGALIVWGSPAQDTRVYVDGVFVPTLYHVGGLRATVNSDLVQTLTFTPGGYGAEHGLGLGGLVDIGTRPPRRDGYHGFVQADLFDVSALVEGPINDKLSFAAAGRYSLTQWVLPLFSGGGERQLYPAYWDYQGKLAYHVTARDELELFFFGSDDATHTTAIDVGTFITHTFYHRAVLAWQHRFARRVTLAATASLGYDLPFQSRQLHQTTVASGVDSQSIPYALRAVARAPLASWMRLDGGVDYEGSAFTLNLIGSGSLAPADGAAYTPTPPPVSLRLISNRLAPFLAGTFTFLQRRLTIVPGFRLAVFNDNGKAGTTHFTASFVEPEPRLSVRYQALRWLAVKAAVGLYHQSPFTFIGNTAASGPEDFSWQLGDPKHAPEVGVHYVAGIDLQPTATLSVELTAFYKDLSNLVVQKATASDQIVAAAATGRAYGGQLLIRQELWHNFFGWVSYTLSRAQSRDAPTQPWHLFQYDQTHILTLLASYRLPRGFQIGLRFRYRSGSPYTPFSGLYDANADNFAQVFREPYSARLPAFHQLDLRVDKTFTFNRWRLLVYVDVQNVYDASNVAGVLPTRYDYNRLTTERDLPIVPVLGLRGEF